MSTNFFPNDRYTALIEVPNSVSGPQYVTLSKKDKDEERTVSIVWKWVPSSIADKEKRVPQSIKILLTRSDGSTNDASIKHVCPQGGSPF